MHNPHYTPLMTYVNEFVHFSQNLDHKLTIIKKSYERHANESVDDRSQCN